MRIPTIEGIIDRRILINFTADPGTVQNLLPSPFLPQVYNGKAIVGICLIRLTQIRPKGLPALIGISSENAAHRIAVKWEEKGVIKNGVYIPRRDTSSVFNSVVGGRIFPGKHFLAKFDVKEAVGKYHIAFKSADAASVAVDAEQATTFAPGSIFNQLEDASAFFEKGSVGYSPNGSKYEGLELETFNWRMTPLNVQSVQSSFFEDETLFPKGSLQFDNALLMKEIKHEWHGVQEIK